jgi:hypothetical protein
MQGLILALMAVPSLALARVLLPGSVPELVRVLLLEPELVWGSLPGPGPGLARVLLQEPE